MKIYDPNNIFAKIINGKIPATKIYEDDNILAIADINPAAPIHILVMPKNEYVDFEDFIQKADSISVKNYFNKVVELASSLNANEYRIITNIGAEAGQTIFHFHTHILAGRELKNLAG